MVDSMNRGFDIWTDAQAVKSKGRLRSLDNIALEGIANLRKLILELAIRGRLVKQDSNDESACELVKIIIKEKAKLIEEGAVKKEKPLPKISEEEKRFELPENWTWVRLGEIGNTNIGLTYAPKNISAVGLLVLRSSNIQNGEIDLTDNVRVDLHVRNNVLVKEGDLLICARNGSRSLVGKCALIKGLSEPMAFGAFMAIYRSSLNEYIKIFLESPVYRKNLDDVTTTTINQITQDNLKNTTVPLPPFAEQKRIVSKVEELMALCDRLEKEQTDNLKTHQALVKTLLEALTQSKDDGLETAWLQICNHFDTLFYTEDSIDQLKETILQLAVMGKLVNQDPADDVPSKLLEKIKKEKGQRAGDGKLRKQAKLGDIGPGELPEFRPSHWCYARLGDILEVINGRAYKMHEMLNTGTPLLRVGNLFTSNEWYYSDLRLDSDKYIDNGDLIYAWSASFGPFIWNGGKVIYHYHIWKLDFFDSSSYDKSFMYLYLLSMTQKIKASGNGIAMIHMTKERMEKLVIPIPPLLEQKRIVSKVNELMALCDGLNEKIAKVQEIKVSLSRAMVENVVLKF